jgi:quinol monooxygenase YgiN
VSTLLITARWSIRPNKADEFRNLAKECVRIVKEKDKDTEQYDWYINEDETEWVLVEKYPNSDALLAHLANIGALFGELLQAAEFLAEIYGKPSEELLKATAGLNIKVYSFYDFDESKMVQA